MSHYAFIDSQNLNKAIEAIGYAIDYRRFRLWLKNRHGIDRAILYFGYVKSNQKLYHSLEKCGFEFVFRDVEYRLGKRKANVDICLTISALEQIPAYDKAYLVTSDGDFFDLVEKLKREGKFGGVISPQTKKGCSQLLKKTSGQHITFLPDSIHKFANKKAIPQYWSN